MLIRTTVRWMECLSLTIVLAIVGCAGGEPAGDATQSQSSTATPDQGEPPATDEIAVALAKLSPEDRALAEKQEVCLVGEGKLGSMGTPVKVDVKGRPIFICCEGCRDSLLKDADKYLAKLDGKDTAE